MMPDGYYWAKWEGEPDSAMQIMDVRRGIVYMSGVDDADAPKVAELPNLKFIGPRIEPPSESPPPLAD